MKQPISHESRLAFSLFAYGAGVFLLLRLWGYLTGIGGLAWLAAMGVSFLVFQGLFGASLMQKVMKVEWQEAPARWRARFEQLCAAARIPTPRFGVSHVDAANAFAFGRTQRDGRVCVTTQLEELLDDDELAAVLAHEVSHIKHWDITVISFLTVVPMFADQLLRLGNILLAWTRSLRWFLFWTRPFAFGIGGTLLLFYLTLLPVRIVSMLALLYISRVCEMNADLEATHLGVAPLSLASALFQLAQRPGNAQLSETARAMLLSNLGGNRRELDLLRYLDPDKTGRIDEARFLSLRKRRLDLGEHLAELFGTHPLLVRRLRQLAREVPVSPDSEVLSTRPPLRIKLAARRRRRLTNE